VYCGWKEKSYAVKYLLSQKNKREEQFGSDREKETGVKEKEGVKKSKI
jgi:hypothetical protein